MSNIQDATAAGVDQATIFEPTPPRRPAAMPRQTITFWTPRRGLAAMRATARELRRPTPVAQRVIVPVRNFNEPE
jgi:hypothetical protein